MNTHTHKTRPGALCNYLRAHKQDGIDDITTASRRSAAAAADADVDVERQQSQQTQRRDGAKNMQTNPATNYDRNSARKNDDDGDIA